MIELIFLKVLILKNVKKHLEDHMDHYGPYLCNGCCGMSSKAVSIKNLAIINHNGNHYRVNLSFISKKDASNLIKNAMIIDKKGTL